MCVIYILWLGGFDFKSVSSVDEWKNKKQQNNARNVPLRIHAQA